MKQTIQYSLGLALAVISTTCGPDAPAPQEDITWMFDVWSDQGVGGLEHIIVVQQIKIQEDGTVLVGYAEDGDKVVGYAEEYSWERDGSDAIIVHMTAGGDWRISPGKDCNSLRLVYVYNGEAIEDPYTRGAVCVGPEIGCGPGIECLQMTYWCEGPPPLCEDEETPSLP